MSIFILLFFFLTGVVEYCVPDDITVLTPDGEEVPMEGYSYHHEFFTNMQQQFGRKVQTATETWLRYMKMKPDELLANIDANQYLFLQLIYSLAFRDVMFTKLLLEQSADAYSDHKPILNEWVRSNLKLPIDVMYRLVESVANPEHFEMPRVPLGVAEEILSITNKSAVFLESCKKGDSIVVHWILETGINFDLSRPFEVAWQNENWDIVIVLINNGALRSVTVEDKFKNTGNETILHLAVAANSSDAVSKLVQEGFPIDEVDARGVSPLFAAIDSNNLAAANILLSNEAEVDLKTNSGSTALHAAVSNGNLDAVKLLLDQDSSINEKNNLGLTAIHIADQSGIFYFVRYLLNQNVTLPSVITSDPNLLPYMFFFSEYGMTMHEDDPKQIENYCEIAQLINIRVSRIPFQNEFKTKLLELVIKNKIPLLTQCAINLGGELTITNRNNESLLFYAVRAGSYDIVRLLLNEGIDGNAKDVNGSTALHVAARKGMLDIVSFLLKRGADINAVSNNGFTALHEASKEGHLGVVNFLLGKGIRTDIIRSPSDKIIYETPLQLAASKGHIKVVKNLLNRGLFNDIKSNKTWTSLHAAARAGHDSVVKHLLDRGFRVNVADKEGKTPLFWAAYGGSIPTVMILLQRGADLHTKSKLIQRFPYGGHRFPITYKSAETPLHVAASNGYLDLCKILIEKGIDKDVEDAVRETPLYNAVSRGHYSIAKFLLEKKAAKTFIETTTLHAAAANNHLDIMDLLLDKGMDVNVRNYYNETPLFSAAKSGHLEAVKYLIDNMAEINAVSNIRYTPLTAAVRQGHYEVSLFLLDNGAKVNIEISGDNTLVMEAVHLGHQDIVKLLIERGALLNLKSNRVDGYSVLHLAAENPKMFQLLLDNHADINAESGGGATPLFSAVENRNEDIVRLLLGSGLNPDTNNSRKYDKASCLHMAASHNSLSLKNVELLLDNGAYIDPQNRDGYTPLHFAIRGGEYDIARTLLDRGADVNIKNVHGQNTYRIAKDRAQTPEDDYKKISSLRLCDCEVD